MIARRYFAAGVACALIAGGLIWIFSEELFTAQNTQAENKVISFEIKDPALKLEITP